MKGTEVYADIGDRVRQAQRLLDRSSEVVAKLQLESERLRGEEIRKLSDLARIRFEELAANRVAGGLDAADRRALEYLEQRRADLEGLREALAVSARRREELEAVRSAAVAEVERAQDERDRQVQTTLDRLAETEDYQAQLARVERTTSQAAYATEKAQRAEADREAKRQPYEADKLFAYLWRRRYRFPEYRAMPLIRTLDGWVAGLCRYHAAHRDYGMLLAIPDRLRVHAESLVQVAEKAAQGLAALESAALEQDGVPALTATLVAAEAGFAGAEEDVETEEERYQALLDDRAAFDAGEDAHSRRALGAIVDQIAREDVATLQDDARRTGTPDDDAAVAVIDDLRQAQAKLGPSIDDARLEQRRAMDLVKDVKRLQREFRQRGYDARNSVFDDGFQLDNLLDGLLSGGMDFTAIWPSFHRHQRFRRKRRPSSSGADLALGILGGLLAGAAVGGSRSRSSSSSSGSLFGGGFGGFGGGSSSSGSSSSGGGFGGGGFGGGGFSTGGGFGGSGGGGGGFSTGGGF